MTDTPKPAPATPAATPLREANQQRVDAAAQRVRQELTYLPTDHGFRKDVELLIEIALAPVLEIFAAAQPQRESEPRQCSCPIERCDGPKSANEYCTAHPPKEFERESEQPEQALKVAVESIVKTLDSDCYLRDGQYIQYTNSGKLKRIEEIAKGALVRMRGKDALVRMRAQAQGTPQQTDSQEPR